MMMRLRVVGQRERSFVKVSRSLLQRSGNAGKLLVDGRDLA